MDDVSRSREDLPTVSTAIAPRTLHELRALARSLDSVQEETARHSERVARLVFAVAPALAWPAGRVHELAQAALLHDVGKIIVPHGVLRKPGPLTEEEFDLVMGHPEAGARMVEGTLNQEQRSWILHHHERFDGRGYPDHVGEREIPEGARILGVVDAFDVMTSGRPYQAPLSLPAAVAECTGLSGSQFDGDVVSALLRILPAVRRSHAGRAPRRSVATDR